MRGTKHKRVILKFLRACGFPCTLVFLCLLLHIHALCEENDVLPPNVKVEISDEDKEFTNRERKAVITITDDKMKKVIKKEYVFKEGKDSFHITVKDASGNESTYRSDVYIQDYTAPEVRIVGITDGRIINGKMNVRIIASDEWLDREKSYVRIKGQNSLKEYEYFFRESDAADISDEGAFSDDYYTMFVYLTDMAGNERREVISFTINRKGSVFNVDSKNRENIGSISEEITGFYITEKNLSRIAPEDVRIIFTHNARVTDLINGTDYRVKETNGSGGYTYTYAFSDELFVKEGVYTISVSTLDEAGNVNDTRFEKESDEIRFAVKKGL